MATATLQLKVRLAWWYKALIPVWFVQALLGFKPWVPRCAVIVEPHV